MHIPFLKRWFPNTGRKPDRTNSRHARLGVEALETRLTPAITYHDGPLIQNVKVENIFVGQAWATDPTLARQATALNTFMGDLTDSSYMDLLKQYSVAEPTAYAIGHGRFDQSVVTSDTPGANLSDAQIQDIVDAQIQAGKVPAPDGNTLYIVFTPPGTLVSSGSGNSKETFAGYHANFRSISFNGPAYYAVLAYPGGVNAGSSYTPLQGLTVTASHEVAEAVTDAEVTTGPYGWYDSSGDGGEIGDGAASWQVVYLDGYAVQKLRDQSLIPQTPQGAVDQPPWTGTEDSAHTSLTGVVGQAFTLTDVFTGSYQPNGTPALADMQVTFDWGENTVGAVRSVQLTPGGTHGSFAVADQYTFTLAGAHKVKVTFDDLRTGAEVVLTEDLNVALAAPKLNQPVGTPIGPNPTFTWSVVPGAGEYDLWLKDNNTGASPVGGTVQKIFTGTSATATSALVPGHDYTWWVQALYTDPVSKLVSLSAWSDPLDFTVQPLATPILTKPVSDLTVRTATDLQPVLTWGKVTGADSYEVWLNDNGANIVHTTVLGGSTTTWTPSALALTMGDTYDWWIKAHNSQDGNVSAWSSRAEFRLQLDKPVLKEANGSITDTQPTLHWNAVPFAATYQVYFYDNTTNDVVIQTTTGLQWRPDAELSPGHGYSFWVRAQTSTEVPGPWSDPVNFDVVGLDTPTLLAPFGLTNGKPTFSWKPVDGADSYELWVNAYAGNTVVSRAFYNPSVTGTSFTFDDYASAGTSYKWWVKAHNNDGATSPWSAFLAFTVNNDLATPDGLFPAVQTTDARPVLSWNAVSGADKYDVWVNDVTTNTSQVFRNKSVTGASWQVPAPLTVGDDYRFWVRALGNNGAISLWSDLSDFTESLAIPDPVAPVGNIDFATPTYSWTSVDNADFYDLQVYDITAGGLTTVLDIRTTQTLYQSPQLTPNDNYEWHVRALQVTANGQVFSLFSDYTLFTVVGLDKPTLVGPSGTTNGHPTFSWNNVIGATGYELWVDNTTTGVSKAFYNPDVSGLSFAFPDYLNAENNYIWWVRAHNKSGGLSPWSAPLKFTVTKGLEAPVNLKPVDRAFAPVALSWDSVPGADQYDVWVNQLHGGTNISQAIHQVETTNPTDTFNLVPGDIYTFWVRSESAAGKVSPWSNAQTFAVDLAAPVLDAPAGTVSELDPLLSWLPVGGATGYLIELTDTTVGTTVATNGRLVMSLGKITTTPDTSLVTGHSYTWRVKAVAGTVESDWSTPMSFAVSADVLAKPTLVSPSGIINGSLPDFSWNAVVGATSYEVQVNDTTSGTTNVLYNASVSETTWHSGGTLTPGDSYSWFVIAHGPHSAISPRSDSMSFTYQAAQSGVRNFTGTFSDTVTHVSAGGAVTTHATFAGSVAIAVTPNGTGGITTGNGGVIDITLSNLTPTPSIGYDLTGLTGGETTVADFGGALAFPLSFATAADFVNSASFISLTEQGGSVLLQFGLSDGAAGVHGTIFFQTIFTFALV